MLSHKDGDERREAVNQATGRVVVVEAVDLVANVVVELDRLGARIIAPPHRIAHHFVLHAFLVASH